MYNERFFSFFGLKYNPFIKNNSDNYRFVSNDSKEFDFKINHLMATKGIGLVTGSPGVGKTSTIRHFAKNLNKSLFKVIYISLTTLTDMDLIHLLVSEFGYEPTHRKSQNIKILQKAIIDYADSKKMTPIIIIDEANYLSNSFLNDLKMILNFKMDSYDKFVVLLVGLPVIISSLNTAAQEPLRQRIVMNFQFEGFNNDDAFNYVTGKIETAGGSSKIFDEGVFQLLSNSSHNNPRIIDSIMSYALLIAANQNSNFITKDIMLNAIDQVSI